MRILMVSFAMMFFGSTNSFAANTWVFPQDNTKAIERWSTGIKVSPKFYDATVANYETMCTDSYNSYVANLKTVKIAYKLSIPAPIELDGNMITSARCDILLARY